MDTSNRIRSIDIMRGLTLVLMLFLNDLFMPGLPSWLGHMKADFDGMGFADWVFPGFLFIVGMVIPYSIGKRISAGTNTFDISKHIIKRSIALIIIGVLMLNSERVDSELTGINRNLWVMLMYVGVFLIWNNYRENGKNFFTITGLRLAGMGILIFLVLKFQSGEAENNGSLIISWWGTLGLIGWGYLVAAFIYLAIRDSILNSVVAFLFFLIMNTLSKLELLGSLDIAKPIFGVIIEGSVPMLVISGMIAALVLKKYSADRSARAILILGSIGIVSLLAGFILRNWFIISKVQATPSWGLICNGFSMILFTLIYWFIDIKKKTKWTFIIKPAGENSLTTYLVAGILYYLILNSGIHLLIYEVSGMPVVAITGSIIWTFLMVGLTAFLIRFNIKLKL